METTPQRILSALHTCSRGQNDASNTLSWWETLFKVSNELEWEPSNPCITYQYNRTNDKLCKNITAMSYSSSANDEISDKVTVIDAAEFISKRHSGCKFALDAIRFNQHQLKNKELQKKITKDIKRIQTTGSIQLKMMKALI